MIEMDTKNQRFRHLQAKQYLARSMTTSLCHHLIFNVHTSHSNTFEILYGASNIQSRSKASVNVNQ